MPDYVTLSKYDCVSFIIGLYCVTSGNWTKPIQLLLLYGLDSRGTCCYDSVWFAGNFLVDIIIRKLVKVNNSETLTKNISHRGIITQTGMSF